MSTKQALQDLYDKYGMLTPGLVVIAAESPGHELHDRFEWDDSIAAARYRLTQAAAIIRSVKVTVERGPDKDPIRVRAFVSTSELWNAAREEDPDDPGVYRPVEEIVENDILRTAWFKSLAKDWQRLKRRAGTCKEFATLVRADLQTAELFE